MEKGYSKMELQLPPTTKQLTSDFSKSKLLMTVPDGSDTKISSLLAEKIQNCSSSSKYPKSTILLPLLYTNSVAPAPDLFSQSFEIK